MKNIYKEKELAENSTVEDFSVVRQEGGRSVKRNIKHYNLDAIISVGYRVSSLKATKFRQWATFVLKNYIQNGYAINTHKITEQRLTILEKVSIILIDNYIDESILTLLSKNQNLQFTLYTQNRSKKLQLDIEKYNKQYRNLEVKITKKFHDRFLICDETVYHFGASFKDLGNKVFAVNKMSMSVNDLLKNI
ncbi:MAG: RhuM family protein [Sulfurimonas sp.]|uniref:RhuM family protein n=1 Tax=Sulfurimonas sp. TaxID=2022749 RepID=UPI0035656797